MTYAAYVECTRCGGNHPLSQCPWPDGFAEAVLAAQVDMLAYGTSITQVSPDGVICHVPIDVWLKGHGNLPLTDQK